MKMSILQSPIHKLFIVILLIVVPVFAKGNGIDTLKEDRDVEGLSFQEFNPNTFEIINPSDSLGSILNWETSPGIGFVFQITNREAKRLLAKSTSDSIFYRLLHTMVDTFEVEKGWSDRPEKGHFIMVRIIENKLHCEYTNVLPYQVFLLKEYDALALQVLDLDGNVRNDARVKLRWKRIRVDPESKTYRVENKWVTGDKAIVTVELDGFESVFGITKHKVPTWNNHYYQEDNGPAFYSYMITDKNRYKPNEKVRFKSYALSNSRAPLRKELELWLVKEGKSKKVKDVMPHRPGSYASEFQLHDSLKLALDKRYLLQLRDKNDRIVSSCHFNYEDYELHGNKLEVNLTNHMHYYPANNHISIVASDVNGLLLKDARATILVKTRTIRETFQPLVILPDTLMSKTINLNTDRATSFDIPSELFKKTNTTYDVIVVVLNSENQRMEQMVTASHYYSQYEITASFSRDSIIYNVLNNGSVMENVAMDMQRSGEIESKKVVFPHREKINAAVSKTNFKCDFVNREINMNELVPKLELTGGIDKDSFNIILANPQQLEVSWFVYQGEALLKKGFGKEFEYNTLITNREESFYVELLYSFGGKENVKQKEYQFKEDYLNVSLDIPEQIYPGQKVEATIQVDDQQGRPVSGVDITAFAVTAKLNYYVPDLPYYGRSSAPRSQKDYYSRQTLDKRTGVLNLNYDRWTKLLRLDTMKYYQFIYPARKPFIHSVNISDSTQFAPFVVEKGNAKQIYVIEVDHMPVYFSWVNQPKSYSFYIQPEQYHQISLRLFDRVLLLDSVCFDSGKKTILSIDFDHLPKGVRVIELYKARQTRKERRKGAYPKFTKTEIKRYLPYISSFQYAKGMSFLESGKHFVPLLNPGEFSNKDIIAGPITPGRQTFTQLPSLVTSYNHTGGFKYAFEDNIVYKLDAPGLIPDRLFDNNFSPANKINDIVMTKKVFLEEPRDKLTKWQPQVIDLVGNDIRLKILMPSEGQESGIGGIVFENCKTGQFTFYCPEIGKSEIYNFPLGFQKVVVVYDDGKYLTMDSVKLQSFTHILIDLKNTEVYEKDSFSEALLTTPHKDCYGFARTPVTSTSFYYPSTGRGNVRGTIYDEINSPLPGVTVVVKGTTIGTVTDVDGNFSLYIPERFSTLQVSYIGFVTQEVDVQIGSDISVNMEMDVQQLQEVVVVGYGTQRMRSLTGALSVRTQGIHISLPEKLEGEEKLSRNDIDSTNTMKQLYQEILNLNTIRSNFSDVGFWEPRLFTDKRGQSKFSITFPDDITRWDATVYAMNRQLKTGTLRKSIKSYKPLMAELHVPQFLTRGDSAFFLGKVLNYTGDKKITGKVQWTGPNSSFEKNIEFGDYFADRLSIHAISADSVTASFAFTREDGYLDGERRTISTLEQGVIRAEGNLSVLDNNEEVLVKVLKDEDVTIEIFDNQLDVYQGDVKYLLNYKYDCNEQLASKVIGFVNYKLLMQYQGKPFKYEGDVNKIIDRLLKNQNEEFLWSWWNVSSNTSYWMSAHILRALKVAKEAGFSVNLDVDNISRKASYKLDFIQNNGMASADLIHALASWGATLDYSKHIRNLDSIILSKEKTEGKRATKYYRPYSHLKEKFLLLEIRQMLNMPFERDSILKYKKEGIMGEVFFSDDKPVRFWYENGLAANAIAYRIIKKDSLLKKLVGPMQMYFLSEKQMGEWNTYQSSNVLISVLPDIISKGGPKGTSNQITLSGKVNESVTKFPYRLDLKLGEEQSIRKESGLPVYYIQYIKERVTKAKTGVAGFEIKTTLGKDNRTQIEAGKPIQLIVEVNVTKEANYENIMIEVPIPGACSYTDKRQSKYGVETHREYFKDRTVIFCDNMKSGKYTFAIDLLPRFTGRYLINPAQVSLMYVPVVNANTDMKAVYVE